ncbi:hypothetical protein GGQ74_001174 [Desulfobaculum xiamenense]|uniref:Uncharacterized protein n=1 Tax=Desulfobaculum xiamenense TaxID=995050 RepID=A0A846QQQ1_9BACT|nr:hypothetical protein [Desulfobaculum xiamenense]NJB67534.1 hypothetical protein [Desulfobaculum xiamenense]
MHNANATGIVFGVVKARALLRSLVIGPGPKLPPREDAMLWEAYQALNQAEGAIENAIGLRGELADHEALRQVADRIETDEAIQDARESATAPMSAALRREQAGCEESHRRRDEAAA